jgi:hypothetical protein
VRRDLVLERLLPGHDVHQPERDCVWSERRDVPRV